MNPQDIEAARVEVQECATCIALGLPPVFLPPVNVRGTTVLPAVLRVVVDSLVHLTLDVANPSAVPAVLEFRSAQQYDFIVHAAGVPLVWRWGADRMFAATLGSRTLAPGEHWLITESWRPTVHGTLWADGVVTSSSHFIQASTVFSVP